MTPNSSATRNEHHFQLLDTNVNCLKFPWRFKASCKYRNSDDSLENNNNIYLFNGSFFVNVSLSEIVNREKLLNEHNEKRMSLLREHLSHNSTINNNNEVISK